MNSFWATLYNGSKICKFPPKNGIWSGIVMDYNVKSTASHLSQFQGISPPSGVYPTPKQNPDHSLHCLKWTLKFVLRPIKKKLHLNGVSVMVMVPELLWWHHFTFIHCEMTKSCFNSIFPQTCRSITCGLGERPINLQANIRTNWLWTAIDRTGPSESGLFMLLQNTTAVVIITLGLMTFEVWHERDSGKAGGGRTYVRLSQTREFKMGVSNPTLCIKRRYCHKGENCVMRKFSVIGWF